MTGSARSWDAVELRLAETDFFLDGMKSAGFDLFRLWCFFDAFVSTGRSVTWVLKAVMDRTKGFAEWYSQQEEKLRANPTAQLFKGLRNKVLKEGTLAISGGSFSQELGTHYYLEEGLEGPQGIADQDAVRLSEEYMRLLVDLAAGCYRRFADVLDPMRIYSLNNLREQGWTIEDVEEGFGFPRGWTGAPNVPDEERIRMLRELVPGSQLPSLCAKYHVTL